MGHLVDDDLTFVTQKVLGDIDTEEVHGVNDSDPREQESTKQAVRRDNLPREVGF
ncbi:hypothetical protein GCM10007979_13330 [Nocardioides albus]|nr:hypothetical protein GCM10007979_13330 [Nocardioides albus]